MSSPQRRSSCAPSYSHRAAPLHILLTGCAGFIGWKVTEFLLADGHTVVGVDNLNDAYDVRLKQWRLAQIKDHPNFIFHRLDIADREALRTLFERRNRGATGQIAVVINLAARAGVRQSVENPWAYYETNVIGTLNLLELCREFGVKRFIVASTSSVYGTCAHQPFREDAVTSRTLSPYAASKKAAEVLCYTYHHLYGISAIILRYFTVYGPAGRPDMMPFRMVQWIYEERPVIIYGDGNQSCDFTYIDDVARGTIAAMYYAGNAHERNEQSVFEIINIGSNRPVKLMEAIHVVERIVGKKARFSYRPTHPTDVHITWADITKAKRLLNWQPLHSFHDGILKLVKWYENNRKWARSVRTD